MKKIVLAAVLVALSYWYFEGGRKMTEADVHAYYDASMKAASNFDSEHLCSRLASDYRTTDITYKASGTETTTLDKEDACVDAAEGLAIFRKVSEASRGLLKFSMSNKVRQITLSERDKVAVVNGVTTVKLGELLVARTRYTEKLIRRNGRILSLGGDSKTWIYGDG